MKRRSICALAVLALLAGCAKPVSKISAVALPDGIYASLDCAGLAAERTRVEVRLADATKRQNKAQMDDAMGVFLIGVPVSSLTGDAEGEIAGLKGQQDALAREAAKKGC